MPPDNQSAAVTSDNLKTCSMCRKLVDRVALLCPHCGSNTEYERLLDSRFNMVIRRREPTMMILSLTGALLASLIAGFVGLMFMGGIVGGFASLAVFSLLLGRVVSKNGSDSLEIFCPACRYQTVYQWPRGSLAPGKTGNFACASCHIKMRVVVQ